MAAFKIPPMAKAMPAPKINVDSVGEALTQVSTPDTKRQRLNRRVVVIFRR
jgi:outer membrane protein OmpA-like peptidoglycan-associated protein